jgi:hypothetical protein
MAGGHVLGYGGVMVILAGAQMRGDPLPLQEDLHGARRQPHLDSRRAKRYGTL